MLSHAELASLKIKDFIFHVVHHGEVKPILFDETPLGAYEAFFLDRVRDTMRGIHYEILVEGRTAFVDDMEIVSDDVREREADTCKTAACQSKSAP
jgi:hypothetical protein